MRGRTLALALALFPALLAAQQGPAVPRPQVRCAAYDSLMAGVTRSDPGIASVQGRGAARFIHIQGTWSLSD